MQFTCQRVGGSFIHLRQFMKILDNCVKNINLYPYIIWLVMDTGEKEFIRYAVYDTVRSVPEGRVTTYGAVARAIGYPNMSRLVGKIMSQCGETDVPAQRVVNAGGKLPAAHFCEDGKMWKKLEEEGIIISNGRIREWKKVFWDPLNEVSE